MKKEIHFKTSINLLLILLLAGVFLIKCSSLRKMANIQKPVVNLEKIRISHLDFQNLGLDFDLNVENPNAIGVRLTGYTYEVNLEQQSFLKGQQAKATEIKSQANSTVTVPLSLNFKDIYQTFQSLKDRDSVNYELKTDLKFTVPIAGEIDVPFNKKGKIPLLKIPSITVQSLDLKKLDLNNADLELKLSVTNPNSLGFSIENFTYQFDVENSRWTEGKLEKSIELTKNQETNINLPFSLNLWEVGQSVYQMSRLNQEIAYNLNVNLELSSSIGDFTNIKLPIEKSGTLRID